MNRSPIVLDTDFLWASGVLELVQLRLVVWGLMVQEPFLAKLRQSKGFHKETKTFFRFNNTGSLRVPYLLTHTLSKSQLPREKEVAPSGG
ncbi:hypothetical protein AVEN_119676-1 [Araneus ventricosus]|uniref:Uncharacterized protein n=1 Tax=Araneus ventricosus TaxID=182803 RepID=A0A4Y2KJC7_ARAVE|nr:hypothetical protein AVEN_119676-1 [Araneus ventricosus]